MAVNNNTYNVANEILKNAAKQIDIFHLSVILPNASQCHKERNELISKNNGLTTLYKSFLSKLSKHHQATLDIITKNEVVDGQHQFTAEEIQAFHMASQDYFHQMRVNIEKLRFFNADDQIIQSYLKNMEKIQHEVNQIDVLLNNA